MSLIPYTSFTIGYDRRRADVKFVLPRTEFSNDNRNAKFNKVFPEICFPEAEFTMWVDGHIYPAFHSEFYLNLLGDYDIAVFKHPSRVCAYREAEEVMKLKLDNVDIVLAQMNRYRAERYPSNFGLSANGVVIRRNNQITKQFNALWWSEIEKGSQRDQLSFNYCIWKSPGIKLKYISGNIYNNTMFRMNSHLKKRNE